MILDFSTISIYFGKYAAHDSRYDSLFLDINEQLSLHSHVFTITSCFSPAFLSLRAFAVDFPTGTRVLLRSLSGPVRLSSGCLVVRVHALHRVGLARRRLPVREDGSIVALHHSVEHRPACQIVQILLRAALLEDVVELEIRPLVPSQRIARFERDSLAIRRQFEAPGLPVLLLQAAERPDPAEYLHFARFETVELLGEAVHLFQLLVRCLVHRIH